MTTQTKKNSVASPVHGPQSPRVTRPLRAPALKVPAPDGRDILRKGIKENKKEVRRVRTGHRPDTDRTKVGKAEHKDKTVHPMQKHLQQTANLAALRCLG